MRCGGGTCDEGGGGACDVGRGGAYDVEDNEGEVGERGGEVRGVGVGRWEE